MEKHEAEALLQTVVGNHVARFRDGQWEAIDALVNHRRKLMVVQRTGWGKSSVYFISTCILRDRGAGLTVIVSPLLALMRNQIEAANRLAIRAETINSTNQDNWPEISQAILADQVDAILISPERLSNETFVEEVLLPVADRVGLLVVDEVHCISDWGHEFENSNQYRQYLEDLLLRNQIKALVATTALGMGYDKPDLGFVIHYQAAGSVVAYYQQVGRAGRAIDNAYGVLLSGRGYPLWTPFTN